MKKIQRTLVLLCVLVLCACSPAFAEDQETTAFYNFVTGYCESGFLTVQDGLLCYYDYSTGVFLPVCTHPECKHSAAGYSIDEYKSTLEMLNDPDGCFAVKMGKASDMGMMLLQWNEKIYCLDCWMDPFNETSEICVYETEVDGGTKLLASPGEMFPPGQRLSCNECMIRDGYMYFSAMGVPFPVNDGNGSVAADQTVHLFKVSLATGEMTILKTYTAQSCDVTLLGICDGILYYVLDTADGFVPLEQCESVEEWHEGFESKLRSSVLGISTDDGKEMILDPRLCDRTSVLSFSFDTVKDGILYSIIGQSEDSALVLEYDFRQRKIIQEYPFRYDSQKDLYPYRVLTDEIMLAFDYETGTFALRNLKTGEIKELSIPGICINGNRNQTDWYDINSMDIQTDPIILDHVYADGRTVKAYITAAELLQDNLQIHDFTGGNLYE